MQTSSVDKAQRKPHTTLFASGSFAFLTLVIFIISPPALRFAYPVMALLCGIYLYAKNKTAYIGFVIWLWFLSAFIRRIIDVRAGFQEPSLVLLTPYLVTGISGLTIVRNIRHLGRVRNIPFVLALAAIVYGIVVGLTKFSLVSMIPAILNWLVPVFFGFLLVELRDQYPKMRDMIQRSFMAGTFLMGLYAVYQFFIFPSWDRFWLQNMRTTTFGEAEAMKIRAFSTMNAPVVFGLTIMCTLLVVMSIKGRFRLVAGVCGFAGLVLSLNRSAWIGFGVGLVVVIWQMPLKDKLRITSGLVICALLFPLLLLVPGTNALLDDKVRTFGDVSNDTSAQARLAGYRDALATLSGEPFGEGVASPELEHKTVENDDGIGPHDSLILELLYSLGWLGTACYAMAIAMVLIRCSASPYLRGPFETSMKATVFAFLAQCLLNDIVYGVVGLIFWTGAALQISAIAYAESVDSPAPEALKSHSAWNEHSLSTPGGLRSWT